MLKKEIIYSFTKNDGQITVQEAKEYGINPSTLRKAYNRGELNRVSRGVYELTDELLDDLFVTQNRYNKGIYSHVTALSLHRVGTIVPYSYYMTFPRGYHSQEFSENNIEPFHIQEENLEIGLVTIDSFHGNSILVYDLERTILDVLQTQKLPDSIKEEMLEECLNNNSLDIDISKLEIYAKKLNREYLLERIYHYGE